MFEIDSRYVECASTDKSNSVLFKRLSGFIGFTFHQHIVEPYENVFLFG